eukprot:TRINITY_DN5167_c0_g2_i1.p2 TRINITY_DN5167_c0_g2~~TRINITY_DN5167_c0_g2_i1.p2  ORF type:complete len:343 (+),score=44.58 TRINITY_DN5167_c0_g2_i1:2085-3113(+)
MTLLKLIFLIFINHFRIVMIFMSVLKKFRRILKASQQMILAKLQQIYQIKPITMNNLFLSYDLSERLKKLGFDEDCFGYYLMGMRCEYKGIIFFHTDSPKSINARYESYEKVMCKAPLWQQALTWINEKLVIKGLETIKFDGFLEIGLEETLIKLNTAIELCEKEMQYRQNYLNNSLAIKQQCYQKSQGLTNIVLLFFNEKKELFLQDKPNAFWTKNDSIGWMHIPFKKGKSNLCSAPLWQQALDWIAENSNLLINVRVDYSYSRESKYYFYTIYSIGGNSGQSTSCLLYTSDAADDMQCVDLGGRRIIKKKKKKTLTILQPNRKRTKRHRNTIVKEDVRKS